MNPIIRTLSAPLFGLFGLTLGSFSQAGDTTFSSDRAALPELYAYHSSYPARAPAARSYPGERGHGYTYPGARPPGYVYPGAEGRSPAQQHQKNFNRNNHEAYDNEYGHQKPAGNSHGGEGHH